jgi:oligosaccharide repeat unit polymerase
VSRSAPTRTGRGLWWLSPLGALSLLVPVTLWLTNRLTNADFELFYREPKAVTAANLLLVTVAVVVLASVAQFVAAVAPEREPRPLMPPGRPVPRQLRTAARVLFWLTLLGYVAYFASGLARGITPVVIVRALVSQDTYGVDLKNSFGGIAGLTTLTQCGIAFVVVATHLLRRGRDGRLLAQLALVLVLTLVRSFVASERLALIEVAVPIIVILAMGARNSQRPARRVVARIAPVVLAPLLLVLFGAFEYSRSWQYFKTRTDEPFALFSLIRFIGYYATSYNNGYLELTHGTFPGRLPLNSLSAFWDAPGISALGLYDRLSAPVPATSDNLLERFANPEFNNPGGVTTPFVDFGLVGGFLFIVLLGVVIGLLYRGFRNGSLVGALLYPVVLTGLFDLPRYLYWTQGRVVPTWVCLIVVAGVLYRAEARIRDRPHVHLPRPPLPRPEQAGAVASPVAVGAPS